MAKLNGTWFPYICIDCMRWIYVKRYPTKNHLLPVTFQRIANFVLKTNYAHFYKGRRCNAIIGEGAEATAFEIAANNPQFTLQTLNNFDLEIE